MIITCIQLPGILGKQQAFQRKRVCRSSLRDEGPGDNDSVRRLWLHSHFTAGTELLDNAKLGV